MEKTGVRRLICVSAAGAFISGDPHMNRLVKIILPRVLATQFADTRRMEDLVGRSDLDWTMVRASRLTNGPATGRYRVSPDYPPRGGRKISRADVANFIGAMLTEASWVRSAPALAY
ncbi:MAG TPA: NAD(P)-binding oxidoreductase [Streptosporangiaceae bacterium]|nr:NAD(P)-binding oxidoreductase [Streptosporangiaceae bacterium]